jgi:sulfoacetaldehyde dehydrogenase
MATVEAGARPVEKTVEKLIARARAAQRELEGWDQEGVDQVVRALAWSIYKPENAERLARVAVETTGIGRYEDKVAKNRRKTFGTLRDLLAQRSVGVVHEDPATGITEIAKPVGVVVAIVGSTNPAATPVNKAMMALKARNAVIVSPSPLGLATCELVVELIHRELEKVGAPVDLVQHVPAPITKELTRAVSQRADLIVATGSQRNVRDAYSSGRPAIGVGSGNVPVIVEASADLEDAVAKIVRSKVFDYATSCSSENSVLLEGEIHERALDAFRAAGGYLCTPEEKARLEAAMWHEGKLSREVIAHPPAHIAELAGLPRKARESAFLMVEEDGVGPGYPFSEEKLSVVLTVYRYDGFERAVELVGRILDHSGAGHSVGIHTADEAHAERLAHAVKAARVLVNQAHAFGNGGAFDNGLNFTLTMGCGTWAGNSISENLALKHFMNVTKLVRRIPERVPSEEELLGPYLERYGA